MSEPGMVILAAGSSSRFGNTKQLLHYNGTSLIEHVVNEAINGNLSPVVVITGAHSPEVINAISQKKIQTVFNERWQQGIGTGIAAGVKKIMGHQPGIDKIIVAVCDQPFVSADLFRQLDQEQLKTGKDIIACAYAGTIGTPVLFARKYFNELLALSGDEGAKKILKTNMGDVATVSFPQGSIDIDTPDDYRTLLNAQKHVL